MFLSLIRHQENTFLYRDRIVDWQSVPVSTEVIDQKGYPQLRKG
jgi:hypothetical protein